MASDPVPTPPVCGCGHEDSWHVEFTGGCQMLGCNCTRFRPGGHETRPPAE
jgi:hypothetical protein